MMPGWVRPRPAWRTPPVSGSAWPAISGDGSVESTNLLAAAADTVELLLVDLSGLVTVSATVMAWIPLV